MSDDKRFQKYIASLKEPSTDRTNSKYYEDIQRLAYELVRYLRMNDDKNEHVNQGNWNFTYLAENMKRKDLAYITAKLMKRFTSEELIALIKEHFSECGVREFSGVSPYPYKGLLVEKSEVDRYLKNKIISYVGFGLVLGLTIAFGTVGFFN